MATPLNANWPLLRLEYCPTSNGVYDANTQRWSDITWRLNKTWSVSRGRQYELDTVMAGTLAATLDNTDGALDPMNASSVFAGYVLPYRMLRLSAQYPGTANLLTKDQATGGEQSGLSGAVNQNIAGSSWTLTAQSTAAAWQGTSVWQIAVPNGATSNLMWFARTSAEAYTVQAIRPAATYSFSAYVACLTAGQNPVMAAQIWWYNANGVRSTTTAFGANSTITGNATATYTRLSVSGTVPSGAMSATCVIWLQSSYTFTASATVYVDGAQFEQNATPSTFTVPGAYYPIFTGGVERWPPTSEMDGTRAIVAITATDALALLPQSLIQASFAAEINAPGGAGTTGPDYVYSLGDSSGSTTFADSTGNRANATILASALGAGTITPGTAITSTDAGQGFVGAGPTATVTRFAVGAGGTVGSGTGTPCSMVVLPGNLVSPDVPVGHGGPPPANFTRMIALRYTTLPATISTCWRAYGGGGAYDAFIGVNPSGHVEAGCTDSAYGAYIDLGAASIGDWHLVFLALGSDGQSQVFGLDAATGGGATRSAPWAPGGFHQDSIGATTIGFATQDGTWAFAGDLAFAVQWPFALTGAQMSTIYNAWRTAYTGDSSNARIARLLKWGGSTAPQALDTGYSTSLGPATDVDGLDVLTAIQNVTVTENGETFVDRAGNITFYNRARRYQAITPAVTFGDSAAAGEALFEDCEFDFDPTNIENEVIATQVTTSQQIYGGNTASQLLYGTRTLSLSNQSTVAQDVTDEANYLAATFAYPRLRAAKILLHPGGRPSLWPTCLGLELGQAATANRRPQGSTSTPAITSPISMNGFVEKIDWSGDDQCDATVAVQLSPAPGQNYGPSQSATYPWNLALLHTTLAAGTYNAGTNTVTINALPTAAASTLAQNLPGGGPGMQVTIGSGLAGQETLTIASVSATTVGYATATITFTANMAHSHSGGEILRELLGTANSATWQALDTYSALDSAMLVY